MTDILLVNPNFHSSGELKRRSANYEGWIRRGNMFIHPFEPPLGLAGLVSYMSEKGFSAKLFDTQAHEDPLAGLTEAVKRLNPRFVGFTSMTPTFDRALDLARIVRKTDPLITTVMGGVHPTVRPHDLDDSDCIDICILGEGEKPVFELLNGKGRGFIKGLYETKILSRIENPKRAEIIAGIERLPMPDYRSFPVEKYIEYTERLRGVRGISMMISRGCPYLCSFCAVHSTMGRKIRMLGPAEAVRRMERLARELQIRGVWFKDSIFGPNRKWQAQFCDELEKAGLDLQWQINTRVDLIYSETLERMKNAGLGQVDLGIESGSPKSLQVLKKQITPDDIRKAVKMAKRHVRVSGFFMIGIPGETMRDVELTFDLARQLELDAYSFSIYNPLPGSVLYEDIVQTGEIIPNNIHFTDTDSSFCEIPPGVLREKYREICDYFAAWSGPAPPEERL